MRFIAQKIGMAVVILVVVSLAVAWLVELIPGTPAALVLGDTSAPGALERFNHEHGYDQPFLVRYWNWMLNALHGDLGTSVHNNQKVTDLLAGHVSVSVEIAILAMAISLLIALPLALYCGAREDGIVDRVVTAISSGFFSLPSFVTAVFLSEIFAARYQLLPTYGWSPIEQGLGENLRFAAMPVLSLCAGVTPLFLRVLRADVVGVLREDFVLSARARGLPDRYILLRHVLRPASVSLFTISALVFGFLLGGSIVIETYFSLPGIGLVVSQAVTGKDLPVIQGVVVLVALIYLVLNTLVDLIHAVIDPRVAAKQ
ncbi:ABC transporter permease [Dactylosporangium sp. CA-092794]|uniref:ABC transporter permease n=1 Tax=Dactylosporangium sp. CA-092794 TaxID=3239929 RepID=UPI003D922D7E